MADIDDDGVERVLRIHLSLNRAVDHLILARREARVAAESRGAIHWRADVDLRHARICEWREADEPNTDQCKAGVHAQRAIFSTAGSS
jgi:hypothetical protein